MGPGPKWSERCTLQGLAPDKPHRAWAIPWWIWIPSPSLLPGGETKSKNSLRHASAREIGLCICIPSNLCVCSTQTGEFESLWLWKHDFEQLSGGKKYTSSSLNRSVKESHSTAHHCQNTRVCWLTSPNQLSSRMSTAFRPFLGHRQAHASSFS